MILSLDELLEHLNTRDECHHIEAKECRSSLGKSARETISAFSNEAGLGGGYLVLGLKREEAEDHYVVVGVEDPDRLQCEIANACREEFNVPIHPEIRVESYQGQSIVYAYIPEAAPRDKPIFIKRLHVDKGSFRRIGSADHRCTEHDLDLLYQLRRNIPYEQEIFPSVTWEAIEPMAIDAYRRRRKRIDANAAELELSDQDLLLSLDCVVMRSGDIVPNIAGLLLFGTRAALRRFMPADARVDYVVTEGPKWVGDPSSRHFSIDYREALVTLLPRLHTQLMGDLPSRFHLEEGALQRSDIPAIPRDVVREALANMFMHRDYRGRQPSLVIRYSNRLEFKNAGYSLKSFDELGQPGSMQRNPTIANVFHELRYAEAKGTGITVMKELMCKAGLTTPPIIETDREQNVFDLVLLPHHLLDQEKMRWLERFRHFSLSDGERRALILARELGAITNLDYRQINGVETLVASKALRHLRDEGLLVMKGGGNQTYYVLAEQLPGEDLSSSIRDETELRSISGELAHPISALSGELAHPISTLSGELTPHIESPAVGLDAIPPDFPPISVALRDKIMNLSKRSSSSTIRDVICELCSLGPLTPKQLAQILGRGVKYVRDGYLSKMITSGELERLYPDHPVHPLQAYVTAKKTRVS